ncbi:MAG: TonB-dependent receptor [Gammaproteobacteria bacterium]|nr:TonB-dependent receptor [Gammaproteobacteria bacterium]
MRKSIAGPLGLIASVFSLAVAAGDLTEVVVTANRVPESLDAALAATTVLTSDQIQSRQARSIEDLLQGVEGLSIGNSGGPGKLTSFFVRGADADHLLVLVDGVRIGSATAGTAALQNLPVEMIQRIEFVRGPRSSLYGSDAIGGVLQIFTHRQTGGGFKPEVALTGGSLHTRRGHAALAGGDERAWFRVQASAESTRGFDACRGSSTQFAGCFTEEPDADGYRYRSGSLAGGWQLDEHTRLEGNLLRATSHAEYDGSFTNESRILQQVAGVSASRELGAGGRLQFNLGRAWDRSRDYQGDTFVGRFETRRDSASLQWNYPLAVGRLLTLGLDHQRDHVASDTAYVRSARDNTALFAQFVGDAGPWRTEFSLRGDDNAQFGQHATGTAAIGYAWSDAMQLLVQAGTGFKAPSFNDLYYPFFGNPELDPERSRSFELAVRGHAESARWRVSLFATRFRDLIDLDANFLPANIDSARVLGIEAGTGFTWRGLRVESGITWQDTENRSFGPNQGNRLARRPRLSGHLDLERRFGAHVFGVRWMGEGDRQDNAANTRRLGGYGTLDLRAETRIARDWRLQVRAANLLDRRYETVAFYNQSGRTGYLTVRYAPVSR